MKRWNDYYDSMDPKKKNPNIKNTPIDPARSASVKYFSVYPRKTDTSSGRVTPAENNVPRQNPQQPTAETSFHGERYTSRPNEFNSASNRGDGGGQTNFAWVD